MFGKQPTAGIDNNNGGGPGLEFAIPAIATLASLEWLIWSGEWRHRRLGSLEQFQTLINQQLYLLDLLSRVHF